MKLLEFKKELLNACFDEIDDRVASLRKVMDEAQQSANDYGQPKDRYDSYRAQLLRKRDLFGQQLYKILEQRNILEKVNAEKTSDIVEFGAVVVTNMQKIFISVGLGKIECRGGDYFVISPGVPIFKAMEGMKAGDSFEFRGQKINILEIS
ncbi:MAG: hypothetical protein KAT76_01715 [Bacteroidales bacterium]|nr:hypothetical protein [Bacteroidales bacterium]